MLSIKHLTYRIYFTSLFKTLTISYLFLSLLWLSQYFLGDILISICFLIYTIIIFKRFLLIESTIYSLKLKAYVDGRTKWFKTIFKWRTLIKISCLMLTIIIVLMFFLFFFSIDFIYKIIIFLDALIVYFIIKFTKTPLKKVLKKDAHYVFAETITSFFNILILFTIYAIYYFSIDPFSYFNTGTLDPGIPVWVKENIHHSSIIFEKILRIHICISMTIENMIGINKTLMIIYKIFHLITMSFWPFVAITFFYKAILVDFLKVKGK